MNLRDGLSALIVSAFLTFSACAAPPIDTGVAKEMQSDVHQIAVLTARGDTADAVTAAHGLATRVRTAQTNGEITGERAVTILLQVEQLIERLMSSGAGPVPADAPQPLAGAPLPVEPTAPSVAPLPEESDQPEPSQEPSPAVIQPAEIPPVPAPGQIPGLTPAVDLDPQPDPTPDPEDEDSSGRSGGDNDNDSGPSGNAGRGSAGSDSEGSDSVDSDSDGPDAVDEDDDDEDSGQGRGRGRGRGGDD